MIWDSVVIALRALMGNKLRSGLTMLGIIIGVASVVALMSIGKGATAGITSQVENLGSNLITISSGRSFRVVSGAGGVAALSASDTSSTLLYSDYEAILNYGLANPGMIAGISPVYSGQATLKYGESAGQFSITGVVPAYLSVNAYEVERGRFITNSDNKSEARVVVLGAQAATDIFSGLNPLGRTVSINGISFEVVGVLASKGSIGFGGGDDVVLVPLETGYSRLLAGRANVAGKRSLTSLSVSAATPEVVEQVISDIELILRREHKVKLSDDLGFSVTSQSQILSNLSTITQTMTLFLAAIAAISLLVGGIGIMNISLVSVKERTREIGLRKAVGAQRSTILVQFLVETLTLAILGGVLGILLGAGIASLVNLTGLITSLVTVDVVLQAFLFAALVGLFFGIYPAYQASLLRPIEALRYE
jgi:putative ABC transport system permease protein